MHTVTATLALCFPCDAVILCDILTDGQYMLWQLLVTLCTVKIHM